MSNRTINNRTIKWAHIISALIAIGSFFLPWVSWDGVKVSGSGMPSGDFFTAAQAKAGLANPFPQFDLGLLTFWLIPVLLVISIALPFSKKQSALPGFVAALLSLLLLTVFVLFSNTLVSLGVSNDLLAILQPWFYIHAIAIVVFVATLTIAGWGKKIVWIVAGPVLAVAGFAAIENYLHNKTHSDTVDVTADFTIGSDALIREFLQNDSAANRKYLDKVIILNGPASAIDVKADSTSTIRFQDSTGSYAIFSLEKSELIHVKQMKAGDQVSLKGVCSGSIYSEILSTTSISFKRAILNKK